MIRTIIIGLVLGATLGVSLASELFMRMGMQPQASMVVVGGFLIATMVVNRGIGLLASFVMLSFAIMQPESVLLDHGFDRDILLAALVSTVLFPVVQRVMHS